MCLGHWNQVSFRATADFASGPAASDRERLTLTGHLNRAILLRFDGARAVFQRGTR